MDRVITHAWFIKTKHLEKSCFYIVKEENSLISPLETIKEFDAGDYWHLDLYPDEVDGRYPVSDVDDSYFLIPKSDVINVWCEKL